MPDVEQLLSENGIRPRSYSPGRHNLTCPKCSSARKPHNRKKACLSLMIEGDRAFWKCHHCGWSGPEKAAEAKFDDRIRYQYPNGNYKIRNPKGRSPPFVWEHEDDHGRVVNGTNGLGYSLYRLEEAVEHGGLIAVVEGEKDVDNLWLHGIPAICSPHGAALPGQKPKWLQEHSDQLVGLDIVVLNDNDPSGYAHAKVTVELSLGVANSVRRLDLKRDWPDIPPGGDISDFLNFLHMTDYPGDEWLHDLLEDAPVVTGDTGANAKKAADAADAKNSGKTGETGAKTAKTAGWFADIALDGQYVPEQEWTVPGRIPARSVCLFTGHGAAGKSTIGLHLCCAHALGRDWLGSMPEYGPSFFIDCEDEFNVIWRRLDAIRSHYSVRYQDLIDGGLHIKTLAGEAAVMATADKNGLLRHTQFYDALLAQADAIKPAQIVIASAANVFAGNENDRGQVQQFHQMLMHLALVTGGSVTLIAHPSRVGMSGENGGGFAGSTQWHNAFRARIYIEGVREGEASDLRKISFLKNQYGPEDESIAVRWRGGMFLPDPKPTAYEEAANAAKIDGTFMALMHKFSELHQPLSPKQTARNYLPTMFERDPDAGGFTKKHFVTAMQRLLAAGRIKIAEWGPVSRRYAYVVLV